MARFYAKFDSGSAGWVSALDNTAGDGYFTRRRISTNSASAALLRDGLITSRSALSVDIYEDLDPTNRDGSKGIYFPPDSGPFSTNNSTFVSWSNAYTSSVAGIVTPADYRTRPTASILSTQTTLVGPASPVDSVGASYTTYINASNAVKAVLDVVQTGAGVVTTPFTRLGNFSSRTLHSIWHDPNLQYFAWDDFTPGTPDLQSITVQNATATDFSTANTNVVYLESGVDRFMVTPSWIGEYPSDTIGTTTVNISLVDDATDGSLAVTSSTVNNQTSVMQSFPASAFARYSQSQGVIGASYQVRFADSTIPASEGPLSTSAFASLGVRAQILYNRLDARATGSFDANNFCSVTPTSIFTINTEASSSRLYENKSGSRYSPPGVNDGSTYYVAFGALDNGSIVYQYDTGVLLGTTSTVTCTTGGTTTTTTTTTTTPPVECTGAQFGVCNDPETPYCCETNGTFNCNSSVCGDT
jgi:hypothetical protein